MKSFAVKKSGFTLIELVIVVAILAVLLSISLIAINPSRQFGQANNTQRASDVKAILDAVYQYSLENRGQYPSEITSSLKMIGISTNSDCAVSCGAGSSSSQSNVWETSSGINFNEGTYSDTEFNTNDGWVELTSNGLSNGTGFYTSQVFDAGGISTWDSLGWDQELSYGQELSSGDASLLMHFNESSGTIIDSSGNSNNGTNNGATYGATGVFNSALDFTGSQDYISVLDSNSLDATTEGTLEAWINPTSFVNYAGIIHKGEQSNYSDEAYSLQFWDNRTVLISLNNGSPYLIGSTQLSANTWSHVAVTWSSSGLRIYVNGVLDRSSSSVGVAQNSSGSLSIGRQYPGDPYNFDGLIDEVAVYTRALSATEIEEHYQRGVLDIRFQVRSCDDFSCSGEDFMGPDGTSSSYYTDISSMLSNVSDNNYFQYRAFLNTSDSSFSPYLNSVFIDYIVTPQLNETEADCIDLGFLLVPDFLADFPFDPKDGTEDQTQYAIRSLPGNRIEVMSCTPELSKTIRVVR